MIKVALIYGQKKYSYGALQFTLTDRSLTHTPYAKVMDALRGLRVVCSKDSPSPEIITAYWHKETKQRVR